VHTPGHQVLYLKLAKTGGVVFSGDLYHYPEERTLDRVPTFEFNPEQTRATRVAIDTFLKKAGAQHRRRVVHFDAPEHPQPDSPTELTFTRLCRMNRVECA